MSAHASRGLAGPAADGWPAVRRASWSRIHGRYDSPTTRHARTGTDANLARSWPINGAGRMHCIELFTCVRRAMVNARRVGRQCALSRAPARRLGGPHRSTSWPSSARSECCRKRVPSLGSSQRVCTRCRRRMMAGRRRSPFRRRRAAGWRAHTTRQAARPRPRAWEAGVGYEPEAPSANILVVIST